MKYLPSIEYPEYEIELIERLANLFKDWHEEAQKKKFISDYSADDMVFDGIYPYYLNQKKKVLFIGRESLGINGLNYIEVLYHAYKKNHIGDKHINQNKFHYLMFYIAFGANNEFPNWDEIPAASEMSATFAQNDGLSFAFMNLSKLSNESDGWKADWNLIDSFINAFADSSVNYFNKEISIINPDLIITMNLENRLKVLGTIEPNDYGSDISKYDLKVDDKIIPLIDLFHFSAPGKSPKDNYYDIIKKQTKLFFK